MRPLELDSKAIQRSFPVLSRYGPFLIGIVERPIEQFEDRLVGRKRPRVMVILRRLIALVV